MEVPVEKRPTWDAHFMSFAKLCEDMSTCCRKKVGAVVVRDKQILSTGFNGVGSGEKHCHEVWEEVFERETDAGTWQGYLQSDVFDEMHREWTLDHEVHAEANALTQCMDRGIRMVNATLYTTWSPCIDCARMIVESRIRRVVYSNEYVRDFYQTEALFAEKRIAFVRCDPVDRVTI